MELVDVGFKPKQERFDLESMEGAWVELRRLNHGESNELTTLRLSFAQEGDDPSARMTIKKSRQYSFGRCIVDHNLAIDGRKLSFRKASDVDSIDAVVGDEIAELIDKHNEDLGDIPNSERS